MKRIAIIYVVLPALCLLGCTACARPAAGKTWAVAGASVVADPADFAVVQHAAELLQADISAVTGALPAGRRRILLGTLGHNAAIDSLVAAGRLDIREIVGGWERFVIQAIDRRTLVVVGSDRRGAAYGAFHLSEALGVDPFYWWADVPVPKDPKASVEGARFVSKSPSVKYRGIFINDEDWGLKPWAATNYEKELGDIGPRTYDRVCELILRLGGNMLAPAMHSCTGAFYSHPESKEVADAWGILITTSHCEPLLLNNAAKSEWDTARDGDWNYATNDAVIRKKWDDRLSEAACYENIYTTAMRGIHDAGLRGNLPMEERVPLLERVIRDQRALLQEHTGKAPEEIPQIFVPYKETMDVYEAGLQVPEDITIVWVDDNYGYMKRVSAPSEQQRSGGSGVYYHVSYLGAPHDYLWLNTTPPVLMYEELMKAYKAGADRYWLLNVGDIKPAELAMKTFFDLARDVRSLNIWSVRTHQAQWLAKALGNSRLQRAIEVILEDYYRLAWIRKPEFMGWEREWDAPSMTGLRDTEFSFDEQDPSAQRRLWQYARIVDRAVKIEQSLPESVKPACFELLSYPVQGAYQMNRKFLMAQLNHELTAAGRHAEAAWAAQEARDAYDAIAALNERYNSMLDGKWRGMIDLAPGYCALYQEMPPLTVEPGVEPQPVDLTPHRPEAEGYYVLDLSVCDDAVEGIGYDDVAVPIRDLSFRLPKKMEADSVTVRIWTLPFWPLYPGRSNAYAVSLDGSAETVCENRFVEYARSWKDQVLCNGVEAVVRFPLDPEKEQHTLRLRAVDEGQMVQRIILDWGGLKMHYVGPPITEREAIIY